MIMCRVSHKLISMNRSICDVIAKSMIFNVNLIKGQGIHSSTFLWSNHIRLQFDQPT